MRYIKPCLVHVVRLGATSTLSCRANPFSPCYSELLSCNPFLALFRAGHNFALQVLQTLQALLSHVVYRWGTTCENVSSNILYFSGFVLPCSICPSLNVYTVGGIHKIHHLVCTPWLVQLAAEWCADIMVWMYVGHVVGAIIHVHCIWTKTGQTCCVTSGLVLSLDSRHIWLDCGDK